MTARHLAPGGAGEPRTTTAVYHVINWSSPGTKGRAAQSP